MRSEVTVALSEVILFRVTVAMQRMRSDVTVALSELKLFPVTVAM